MSTGSNTNAANAPLSPEPSKETVAKVIAFVVIGVGLCVLTFGLIFVKGWYKKLFEKRADDQSYDVEKQVTPGVEVDVKSPLIITISPVRPEKIECPDITTKSSRRAVMLESPTKLLEMRGANTRWSLPPLYFQSKQNVRVDGTDDARTHSMIEQCDLRGTSELSPGIVDKAETEDNQLRWPSRLATKKRRALPPRMRPATGPRIARFREEGLDL